MPAMGSGGYGPSHLPPPPKPSPARSVGKAIQAGARSVSRPAPRPTVPRITDNQLPGPSSAQVTAYKRSPAYHHAVTAVFKAQPTKQKIAIIRGLAHSPQAPELPGVQQGLNSLGTDEKLKIIAALKPGASDLAHNTLGDILNPANIYGGGSGKKTAGGLLGSATPFAKGTYGARMVPNFGKDVVNLPAEAFATVGMLGGDVLSGKPGKALSDVVSPLLQTVEHPLQSIVNHPLDTYLMATGALHGITRPIAGAARAMAPAESAIGRSLALERPDVRLAGNLTHSRPAPSPYPLIQAAQKIADAARFTKGPEGSLIARRQALQDKLTALETSRETGMIERVRRANRDQAISQRMQAVQPARAVRAAKQTARSLAYGKKPVTLAGTEALGLVPDATLRSPATAAEDLGKYVRMVSANRPNLLGSPLLKEHDANVAKLTDLQRRLQSGKVKPDALFRAASAYAKDYRPLQQEAASLGHFGPRSQDALRQRELAHYAILHMGARYDPELEALTLNGARLPNKTILDHMKANGVRHETAFTSDKPKPGSAFYVSSERRPLPENARNTYFAYTHGLTDTSHDALLRQHVRMQGVIDAHKAQNRLLDQLAVQRQGGGYWPDFKSAKKELPSGYVPVRLGQPFHPQESLDQALEGVHPTALDEEAAIHGLDLAPRLQDSGPGKYAGISKVALQRLEEHRSQITPHLGQRLFTSANTQFRRVALSTSAKHVPGVASEQIIRDISSGVGLSSWITGHRILGRAAEKRPREAGNVRTRLTGGQLAGATQMAARHFVAERYQGTSLYPFMKGFEKFMAAPGARQLSTAWRGWTTFAISGTKRVLEEQHQIADVGKAALRDFGSQHGPFFKALRLHGRMLDDAALGLFDPAKQRQLRRYTEQIRGRWNDLTPHGQMALMYSPFGLWWINSLRYLGRAPIDQPVKVGALAAATAGTQQERQANGLDMFSAGRLPDYMQGGIPLGGGRVLAQNYYSPFGVANDPLGTAGGLIEPWAQPMTLGALGLDWLGKPLSSPGNPRGRKPANTGERLGVILNSALSSFLPLYAKAQQIAQGGASAYDSSTLFSPRTKTPGKGPFAGLKKAATPYREYKVATAKAKAKTSGGFLLGGSPSSSGYLLGGGSGTGHSGYLLP